jgi:menaquinone-specific isochorismate synthase
MTAAHGAAPVPAAASPHNARPGHGVPPVALPSVWHGGPFAPTTPAGATRRLDYLVSRARVLAPGEVDDLLAVLGSDGFAWLRGGAGFVTAGVAARLPVEAGPGRFERAADEVSEALRSITVDGPSVMGEAGPAAGPIAVGALPFGDRTPGMLVVPALLVMRRPDGSGWVTTTAPADAPDADIAVAGGPEQIAHRNGGYSAQGLVIGADEGSFKDLARREDPSRAEWTESVRRILTAIDAGDVRKVVLARQLVVEAGVPFDRRSVLDRLRRSHPSCFTYAAGSFVGASPELLVRRRGDEVASCPMAGTVPRGATPEDDDTLTTGLRRSVKEAEEHRLLVDAVVAALAPVCVGPPKAGEPDVVRFPTVSHLATRVRGVLRRPAPSALALAGLLHPTPAVGGLPRAAALATIADLEGFDRGLYAGPVGWVDAGGDGEWAVALRGAQLDGPRARLVAGAGIVAGSDPEAEWAETEAKLRPMLAAVGALPA